MFGIDWVIWGVIVGAVAIVVPIVLDTHGHTGSSILTGQSACGLGCGPLFAGAVESYPAG
jgi:hypothetical protein